MPLLYLALYHYLTHYKTNISFCTVICVYTFCLTDIVIASLILLMGLQIVEEEPNKNYFSPLSAIPKTINSIWELIRSFVIPYTKGPDYKEGTLLRVHRVIGLMIAGIPAHSTQDYVNATRLGDPNLYISITNPATKEC